MTIAKQNAKNGKVLHISKGRATEIIKKNREMRIQIKSMMDENKSTNPANSRLEVTKRALSNEKNFLLKENEDLLLKFKKTFMI